MHQMTLEQKVEHERKLVFELTPKIELVNACSIQNGILRMNADEAFRLSSMFLSSARDICFFIPASGSGSRMFEFLYDFFKHSDEENRMKVERFLNHINDFAFNRMIDPDVRLKLESGEMSLKDFAAYIVEESGLDFGNLPKGLIPFHTYDYFVLNPFQEHILQICKSFSDRVNIHFTVNYDYLDEIKDSIRAITRISAFQPMVHFSQQNKETDSLVFSLDGELLKDDFGNPITRPAGHGTLLENLNSLDSRFIFMKNIDNIQHSNHDESASTFAMLGGLLLQLNDELLKIWNAPTHERYELMKYVQEKFKMFHLDDMIPREESEIDVWLKRPKRICGMVKNEGQPGGGPFWVKRNGKIEKQIVEKVQIAHDSEQMLTLVKSTHFNPVMMVCDIYDFEGNKFDLKNFQDPNAYMVVDKKLNGTQVRFIERAGLWNGSMADWITVFVEISSDAFSPVKDVLNLLDNKHLG
jgi:hypothetical protein